MLPDKKIIAFDVDRTLTESKTLITDGMAALLKEVIKRKRVIAIAGGSFPYQIRTLLLPPLQNDIAMRAYLKNFSLLPTSGSQCYEYDETNHEWKLVYKEQLPASQKEKAIKLLEEIIMDPEYGIPPNPYGNIIEDRDTQITFTPNGQQAPVEIKLKFDPDRRKREKIVQKLALELPELTFLINGTSSIDILPKGFNKAVGLERYLNKIGYKKDDVLFVGDGLFPGGNDYAVKEAGFDTIAVKNPSDTEALIKEWLLV